MENLIDSFFKKQKNKTSHETLLNDGDELIPGGRDFIINKDKYFYTHINYHSIKQSLAELLKNNKENGYTFVETGCSAHGTKSTLLWDKFVNIFGGNVYSVDLNQNSVNTANSLTSKKTTVVCNDSLKYLPSLKIDIDFLYLDSYDVDFLDPVKSAEHHLAEFLCVKDLIKKGTVVLIDDTPVSPEWLDNGKYNGIYDEYKKNFNKDMCGKGSLVMRELEKMGATKISHQYQVLYVV